MFYHCLNSILEFKSKWAKIAYHRLLIDGWWWFNTDAWNNDYEPLPTTSCSLRLNRISSSLGSILSHYSRFTWLEPCNLQYRRQTQVWDTVKPRKLITKQSEIITTLPVLACSTYPRYTPSPTTYSSTALMVGQNICSPEWGGWRTVVACLASS